MLHFIENNGMAFGMEMGGNRGNLFLGVFRIIAICGIVWFPEFHNQKESKYRINPGCQCHSGGAIWQYYWTVHFMA